LDNKPEIRKERKRRFPWLELVFILLLIIGCIGAMNLTRQGIQPYIMLKKAFKEVVLDIVSKNQGELMPPAAESMAADKQQARATEGATKAIGSWSFSANKIDWKGDTVYVLMSVRNCGIKPLQFGLEDQPSDWWPAPGYRIYAVDSVRRVFREAGVKITDAGFYSWTFDPGEEANGTLKYTVDVTSGDVYLYVYCGNTPVYPLFLIGSPR